MVDVSREVVDVADDSFVAELAVFVSVVVSGSFVLGGPLLGLCLERVEVSDSDEGLSKVSLGFGLGFTIDVEVAEGVAITVEVIVMILEKDGGGAGASSRGCKKDIEVDDGLILSTSALLNALVATSAAVRGKCMRCSRVRMCARGRTYLEEDSRHTQPLCSRMLVTCEASHNHIHVNF